MFLVQFSTKQIERACKCHDGSTMYNFLRSWQTFADGLPVLDSSRLYTTPNFDVVARETCCVEGSVPLLLETSPLGGLFFDMWQAWPRYPPAKKIGQASPLIRLKTPRLRASKGVHLKTLFLDVRQTTSIIVHQTSGAKRVGTTSWFNMIHVDFLSMTRSQAHQGMLPLVVRYCEEVRCGWNSDSVIKNLVLPWFVRTYSSVLFSQPHKTSSETSGCHTKIALRIKCTVPEALRK